MWRVGVATSAIFDLCPFQASIRSSARVPATVRTGPAMAEKERGADSCSEAEEGGRGREEGAERTEQRAREKICSENDFVSDSHEGRSTSQCTGEAEAKDEAKQQQQCQHQHQARTSDIEDSGSDKQDLSIHSQHQGDSAVLDERSVMVGSPSSLTGQTGHTGLDELTKNLSLSAQGHDCHGTESNSEEEEEEEEEGYGASGGYMLLPQDPDQEVTADEDHDTHWLGGQEKGGSVEGEEDTQTEQEVKPTAMMEESQASAIRQAMAGFSLPSSAVPHWARVVPEDVWKAKLIGGLKRGQEDNSH